MRGVEVLLVVASPNVRKPSDNKCLLIRIENKIVIPTIECNGCPRKAAKHLMMKHTGLSDWWVNLIQTPAVYDEEKEILKIPFGCMVPQNTNTSEAEWFKIMELFSNNANIDEKDLSIIADVCSMI